MLEIGCRENGNMFLPKIDDEKSLYRSNFSGTPNEHTRTHTHTHTQDQMNRPQRFLMIFLCLLFLGRFRNESDKITSVYVWLNFLYFLYKLLGGKVIDKQLQAVPRGSLLCELLVIVSRAMGGSSEISD